MANYNAPITENQSLNIPYSGVIDVINFLKEGLYKFQLYGGGGGNISWTYVPGDSHPTGKPSSGSGGQGGYSVGYKLIEKGSKLYACIGGAGGYTGGNSIQYVTGAGGFNGGGNGWNEGDEGGSGGGGATHIATRSGTLAQLGNTSGLLIVAGGGGGAGAGVDYANEGGIGGSGGGTTGGYGQAKGWDPSTYKYGEPGTQTSGNAFGQGYHGRNGWWAGSGGGLYGGAMGTRQVSYGAPGGSGYIGGMPTIKYKGVTYSPATRQGGMSAQNNGKIIITLIKKGTPTLYYGDKEVDALFYGDREVDALFYGDREIG